MLGKRPDDMQNIILKNGRTYFKILRFEQSMLGHCSSFCVKGFKVIFSCYLNKPRSLSYLLMMT